MNFGYGPANEVKQRLLTLWNSYSFFVGYAEIEGFAPTYADLEDGPPTATPLDRYLVARGQRGGRPTAARRSTRYWTPTYVATVESLVDDLSNWYIRGSRARFWRSGADDQDAAFRTLWYALVQVTRLIAPSMPFLAEELWQNLVDAARRRRAGLGAPGGLPGQRRGPVSTPRRWRRCATCRTSSAWAARCARRRTTSCASRWPRRSSRRATPQGRASIEQHCARDRRAS